MAEEQQNPEEEAVTPEYADAEKEVSELEEIETKNTFEESVTDALEATAKASEDNPIAEAWDKGVKGVMETIEDNADHSLDPTGEHHYSDEVVLPFVGTTLTMPGGIYTFVFLVLAAITVLEVLITFLPENAFIIGILVLLSLTKAYLVVMFYMHLNNDNKLFRLVVILPLLIVLLSTLYLLGVPATAGLGYN